MTRTVRIALVVVGLAAAVYGAASLTGGWLGTPPWYAPPRGYGMTGDDPNFDNDGNVVPGQPTVGDRIGGPTYDGGPIIDVIIGAAGLGVAVFALWSHRSSPPFRPGARSRRRQAHASADPQSLPHA